MSEIIDSSIIWDEVKALADQAQADITFSVSAIQEEVQLMLTEVEAAFSSLDFTPDDYDPPKYEAKRNYTDEAVLQERRSVVGTNNYEYSSTLLTITVFYSFVAGLFKRSANVLRRF